MSEKFVKRYSYLMEGGRGLEALRLVETEDREIVSNALSEVVHSAVPCLTEFYMQHNPDLYESCKAILNIVAKTCNPMEAVLEFLEQMEFLTSDAQFFILLEPLGTCMTRMLRRGKAIDWCLYTVKSYIKNLPTLDHDADQEAADNKNINVCRKVVLFLEPFVHKAVKINSKLEDGSLLGDSLLSFLIFLHGKPFCIISEITVKEKGYKELSEKMMALIFCLTKDPLYFLDVVGKRYTNAIGGKPQDADSHTESYKRSILFESSRNIPNVAYANFYFCIITEERYWRNAPQVYNLHYILEKCMYLFHSLLHSDSEVLIRNGLTFMESVTSRIPPRSVRSKMLELAIYLDIFKPIINVMIYHTDNGGRRRALNVFRKYIELFNMEARYFVLLYLYEIAQHSGVLSLITNTLKSSIIECLDSAPRNYQFLGRNMELILKKTCNLPHGSSSDLVEMSDEIITALNLLRFLLIRDKLNETGTWDIVDALGDSYLKPLQQGIHMSKAHWRVKIQDLEHQKKDCAQMHNDEEMERNNVEVTLSVGGQQLPIMPLADKISFCHQALNGLDVMESILIRIKQCASIGKTSGRYQRSLTKYIN